MLFEEIELYSFLSRFDTEVIEQRKKNILNFLYYCSENPVIYRSQCFVKFFEDANSPKEPTDDDLESSTDNLVQSIESQQREQDTNVEIVAESQYTFDQLSLNADYLFDSALSFSQAVQAEANLRYNLAFDLYKAGIDKLLTGAKNDLNERRKRIAKTKAQKYLEKAEQLYENYILQQQEIDFFIEDADDNETQSISSLERPISNLARYKVIKINERIMNVQDCTDKKMYVIKVIWKSHTNRVLFMPQKIPYMVSLLSYFSTENVLFLLLPFVSGGLLWNYVKNYKPSSSQHHQLEELFVEPPKNQRMCAKSLEPIEITGKVIKNTDDIDVQEEAFEALDEIDSINIEENLELAHDEGSIIPSFDTLSNDIDINDLMKVSQKLLQSVTKTLEKSIVMSINENDEIRQIKQEIVEEELLDVQKKSGPEIKDEQSSEQVESVTPLPEMMIKRWIAEIIVAVNSLHKNGIILGDLNLDNILLGKNGHVAITFFHQRERNNYQQLCFLDSRAVKNYHVAFDFPLTKISDYYSIGVVAFELLTQSLFCVNHPSGITRFNEIQYPESANISMEAKDLLQNLILSSAKDRPTFDDLIQHAFFKGVDFDEIEKSGLQ